MNALLYSLVVLIWGTTWIAIFLQQGPVAAPVSIFWRFAVASATIMMVLLALGHAQNDVARSPVLYGSGMLRVLLQFLVFLHRGGVYQHRAGVRNFLHGRAV